MSFRLRLILSFLGVVLVPGTLLLLGIRLELTRQVESQYRERLEALTGAAEEEFAEVRGEVGQRLGAVAEALSQDNRFRLALTSGNDQAYMLDYAGRAMRLTGLEALQVQDTSGRILSSGHFRNEYDRLESDRWRVLLGGDEPAGVLRLRAPEGGMLVYASVDSVRLAGRWFTLLGGVELDRAFLRQLAPGEDVVVALQAPGLSLATSPEIESRLIEPDGVAGLSLDYLVREIPVVVVPGGDDDTVQGRVLVAHALAPLRRLEAAVTRRFAIAFAVTILLTVLMASWVAARLSRPLGELAEKTARLDLTRLDVDFATARRDEVGTLSRLLASMVDRLRSSATRLREAERRATAGDLARQLNHDIKNGLVPIRNVFRHLADLRTTPDELATVFEERLGTVDSSIQYLEELAANYARLSPKLDRKPCDLARVLREVVRSADTGGRIELQTMKIRSKVLGDAVVLHRIFENVVRNALDSLTDGRGQVTVSLESAPPMVRAIVADTGRGMTQDELDRAFEEFYTTKESGTGLGLAIVRRLVLDLGGTLRVETEPGAGTRVIVALPVVESASEGSSP